MLHLYRTATGELVSSASIIENIPDGMAVKESFKNGIWNTDTLDFDEVIEEIVLAKDDFLDLFYDDEIINIIKASSSDTVISEFLSVLNYRGRVRINTDNTKQSIIYIGSKELLRNTDRAAEILNV